MIGTIISHYKILEKLGEGGMGVVYKAQDTTLDRVVALKFLPSHLSASVQDKARFIQEAKAAAALNHPNICTIYGVEDHDGQMFIEMEYVEGHTLREKSIRRGDVSSPNDGGEGTSPLQLKQSIEIGIQIADGLAAAHEKGIVHRDVKPENIMIQKDGRVRIMDFGLAKLKSASRLTKVGSTVGTTGYMSPEQVQGMESDHRSDIFSLGVILYEMFAGQSPFKGVHETAINYEIVNVDPDPISATKPDIAPELDALVLECMAKDPTERSQSAAEVAKDLRHYKRESSRSRMSSARPAMTMKRDSSFVDTPIVQSRIRQYLPWSIAAVAMVAAAVLLFLNLSRTSKLPTIQALIPAPKGMNFHSFGQWSGPVIISPDGSMLAFVSATPEGKTMMYLRRLDAGSAVLLPGTEGAYYPFWSYDSKWIAFFSTVTNKLKKVDVAGNPPVTICDASNCRGGSWGSNDMIVFSPGPAHPLVAVPASGGSPVAVTRVDTLRKESSQRWPHFLPDGKHFLYFSRTVSFGSEAEGDAVMVSSLDGGPSSFILNSSSNAAYASGYLLFMRGASVLAHRFDPDNFSLTGDALSVAEGVINDPGFSLGVFSTSQNGILAYQTGVGLAGARMVIVDRRGKPLNYLDDVIEHFGPRISPNGERIVLNIFEPKSRTQNLWMYDLARQSRTRFTSGLTADFSTVWSPDGKQIAYIATDAEGRRGAIRLQPSSGGSSNETVLESEENLFVSDWSPNGDFLCLTRFSVKTQTDVLFVNLSGEKKIREFAASAYNESDGRFSPDGRWIAYSSDETGQTEVYLRPLSGSGSAIKVSSAGGTQPVWKRDGKELFFVSKENKMMAAEIRSSGSSIFVGAARELFARTPIMAEYDVFPDGNRFLINRDIEPTETDPVTIVVNWTTKLKK
jgi:serine/threonine protein kinase